jgi:DeoR/GlpR family transcriptional regulator of sugar metabolism
MGFDDDFSAVELFIPGGKVRQGTQAIIRTNNDSHEILRIAEHIGGFDIGVIGVNGVDLEKGFTTHTNIEVKNKIDIMRSAKTQILAGDSSKIGIVLEEKIADFSDDIQFVVDNEKTNDDLRKMLEIYKNKIVLA